MNTNEQQNYTKNYSLLRLFDLEAAKSGDKVCWKNGDDTNYIHGPDDKGEVCYSYNKMMYLASVSHFRMKPLAWVEGKPVYKGDVLWYVDQGFTFSIVVTGNNQFSPTTGIKGNVKDVIGNKQCCYKGGEETWDEFSRWSWNKPKTKCEGWVNVYRNRTTSGAHETKEIALQWATKVDGMVDDNYITTVRIEWEE